MVAEIHTCPRCELRFASVVDLQDHLGRDHQRRPEPPSEPAPVRRWPDPVVVPLDPTRPQVDRALHVAAALARRGGLPLQLVAVATDKAGKVACDAMLRSKARLAHQLGTDAVGHLTLEGAEPASAVLDHVATQPCSFLCLASRARSAFGEAVLGSVSEQIVRRSPVPVVLVGPAVRDVDGELSDVIACIADQETGPQVAGTARSVADLLGSELSLLQVVADDTVPNPLVQSGTLTRLSTRPDGSRVRCEVLYRAEPPASVISERVAGDDGALLVTGTSAPPGLGRLRRGSVALDLVRRAPVPVLVTATGDGGG